MPSDGNVPTGREPVRGDATDPGTGDEILKVRRLVKVYRGAATPAVDGIDFAVRRGKSSACWARTAPGRRPSSPSSAPCSDPPAAA